MKFEKTSLNKKFILCDVDGTIAIKSEERGIYDFEKCYLDKPNFKVIDLLNILKTKNFEIIFITGRSSKFLKETLDWIKKYISLDSYFLYSRSETDNRKDDLVKKDLLQDILKDFEIKKSDIYCVFDDRLSVIKMWISESLFVFNVNNGRGEF